MNKAQLQAYAKVQGQIKELEGKRDQLKVDIIAAMHKDGVNKSETSWGTFTVASKKVYKYSEKVEALVEKMKIAKVREEENGTAKVSITEYLVYTK